MVTETYHRVDVPIALSVGPSEVVIRTGYLFPVFSGRFDKSVPGSARRGSREFVGFVWTAGEGNLGVRFETSGDAIGFANHMALIGKHDVEPLRAVASQEQPYRSTITEGIVLGIDPLFEDIYLGPARAAGTGDVYEVVVYGDDDRAKGASRRAQRIFRERMTVLEDAGAPVNDAIAWDRLGEAMGVGSAQGSSALLDVHGPTRLGYAGPAVRDEWITAIRDDSGAADVRRRVRVLSLAHRSNGTLSAALLTGETFPRINPADPFSAPAPPTRVQASVASSRVYVQDFAPDAVRVDVQSNLELRVVGEPIQWFDLAIPKMDTRKGSFEVVAARLEDGTSVIGQAPLLTHIDVAEVVDPTEDDPDEPSEDTDTPMPQTRAEDPVSKLRILLPTPARAGDTIRVELHWRDTWPWGGTIQCGRTENGGTATGLQRYLPTPTGAFPGNPWRFSTDVAIPGDRKWTAAVSGPTTKEWEAEGWRWVRAQHTESTTLWPEVSVGRWKTHREPAVGTLPAIRVNLFEPAALRQFGPQIRQILDYYSRWMPAYDGGELDVFESPARCGELTWVAPHGMVNVQKALRPGQTLAGVKMATLSWQLLAHELAHQEWGHLVQPASTDDFWMAESLSEAYACMYVGAAFGWEKCAESMDRSREFWERGTMHRRASLSGAYRSPMQTNIVYKYGPALLASVLRPRIGDRAYFQALDLLAVDYSRMTVTTEQLQHYFTLASGRDQGDFFDFWVHSGFIPSLELHWQMEGQSVRGLVESDIPFGAIEVPIQIGEGDEAIIVWVDVRDGRGTFEHALPEGATPDVALDPARWVLARSRRASRSNTDPR
jgi:hypothetical protein